MKLTRALLWIAVCCSLVTAQSAPGGGDERTLPGGAPRDERPAVAAATVTDRAAQHVQVDLAPFFAEAQEGCFVLLDVAANTWTRYRPERCRQQLSPCSTFKVAHSLIGLETGVLADGSHRFRWDGQRRDREVLDRDHTLRSALRHSVVWYYQELAASIGADRMQRHIDALRYGNRDLSGGLTTFWLGSSLQISADEQVALLAELVAERLPLSGRSQALVKELLVLDDTDGVVLAGKTGSGKDPDLGWFVGWVVRPEGTFVFAANASGPAVWGNTVRKICEAILADRGLLAATPSLR